jgi:hypothetical protein
MQISNYSNDMDILGPFIKDEKHNGEDIHKVINNVHLDYEAARLKRKDIELTIYYRDLLSFLIKKLWALVSQQCFYRLTLNQKKSFGEAF